MLPAHAPSSCRPTQPVGLAAGWILLNQGFVGKHHAAKSDPRSLRCPGKFGAGLESVSSMLGSPGDASWDAWLCSGHGHTGRIKYTVKDDNSPTHTAHLSPATPGSRPWPPLPKIIHLNRVASPGTALGWQRHRPHAQDIVPAG